MAQTMGLPFLGTIPIHRELRIHSDAGTPLANWESPRLAESLDRFTRNVASRISIASFGNRYVQPTLSVR